RTHQTVRPFIETGLPWEQFAEINEMNWGVHEGKESTPAMIEEYNAIKSEWGNGNYAARIEGGESAAELAERIHRFVDHLRQREEELLLVCSHGRAMSALMSVLRREELRYMNKYIHHNTGLWKTHFSDGAFHFEIENDTQHLGTVNEKR
ncbi:MAG: histidine phosphatase family protein, partial [Lewinella sp.]|nr:histidine phosphatase family protein [Lewinella sp.]